MAAERSTIEPLASRGAEVGTTYERELNYRPDVDFVGDRVYWGPIIAGFLTALTTMALLSLVGLATGLTAINAGQAATQGAPVAQSAMNSWLWAAFSAVVAFLVGGFVTGQTAGTYHRGWGMLNGMMVFMLTLPFTLWLATVGMGAIVGGLGSFAGGLAAGYGPQAAEAARQVAPNVPSPIDATGAATHAAESLRNGSWGALLGGILGLIASGLGGYLGTRSPRIFSAVRTTTVD